MRPKIKTTFFPVSMRQIIRLIIICICIVFSGIPSMAQISDTTTNNAPKKTDSVTKKNKKKGPKTFEKFQVQTSVIDTGMFTIYFQEDKYYFEIPDSLLNRDILIVNRIARSGADLRTGMTGYAGDQINEHIIRFEQGPNDKIFLKNISFSERSSDSSQAMYRSVMNSNLQPIAASFPIFAHGKDKKSAIVDMTSYIDNDNSIFFFSENYKKRLRLGALKKEMSYINDVKSFPNNIEIVTIKTYSRTASPSSSGQRSGGSSDQTATLELNTSILLLPKTPMKGRYYDPRVGYFTVRYTDFDANPQGVETNALITRWRLEPKLEDMEKYKRGELVEPKKPIVFYIDPATPEKWVNYLIQGVNDWQKAFEQAGFKNAIIGKRAPTPQEDPEWSLQDARYSAIVYKPSAIPNASGPHVHDPRSGEILESHINWYHSVMTLLRNWYLIQAAPNDERARKMQFDDELMGELIRFVSSHEVGHTLGLRHNFGSSSAYPVEKLRDKKWVKKHGHAASIMDYARFNYVAQPGDGIEGSDLYPRINYYDKWAIEWGYSILPGTSTSREETPILNQWILAKADDPKYWFGTESNPDDPRSQSEDLGNDATLASTYGIKNLQRIVPNLEKWTKLPNKDYDGLKTLYGEVFGQFRRYMGHVTKNIGGIYETPKTSDQRGPVYELVPRETQENALAFLNQELFHTPKWLLDYNIANKTGVDVVEQIGDIQDRTLGTLLSSRTLDKLIKAKAQDAKAYGVNDLFSGLETEIWSDLKQNSDVFRRNLQKTYVQHLVGLLNPPKEERDHFGRVNIDPTKSDIASIARGKLWELSKVIQTAIDHTTSITKYHLLDLEYRVEKALNPGG